MNIKKILFIIGILIIILFISLLLMKDRLLKSMVAMGVTKVTGAPVEIDGFSLDILNSVVRIKGFKMYNPAGFPKDILIDIPTINAEYDLSSLLKKKLHLPWIEFDLKDVIVIKNKDRKLNVDSLKFAKKEHPQTQEKTHRNKSMPLHIELLKLSIGRVIYKDFSVGEKPSIQVFDLGIKKTYRNITSAHQLASLMLVESLRSTTIEGAVVYGVATLAGTSVLPVGVAAVLIGKDSAKTDFNTDYDLAYKVSLEVMDELGDIVKTDETAGFIKGQLHGIEVIIKISKKTENTVHIAVSARKLLIPKPHIAEGVLYEISEKLK